MANSFKRYTGDGTTTDFNVPFPYLDKTHVGVKVDGGTVSFSWLNGSTVRLDDAPTSGTRVEVRRTTPTSPLVDYVDGAVIFESDLDTTTLQSIYLSEEATDNANDALGRDTDDNWDAKSKLIKNVADPVDAQDAVSKTWAETGMTSQLTQATDAKDAAETAQTGAETAETNAAASESAAATSESNAATSETNAAASESAAATSETNAAASESAAAASESAAATSETNAAASESAAATSETNAAASEAAAEAAETGAETAETNADASATESFNWAQYAEDSPVPEGDGSEYSAYHWAQKADAIVNVTAAGVSYDNIDSTLTAADVKAALDELDSGKLNLAGGTLTGTVQFDAPITTPPETLTSSTSIALSMAGKSWKRLVLDDNTTITVSGEVANQQVEVWIVQGTTGGTAAWSGVDKWVGGSAPTLSTTEGEVDIIILSADSDGSTIIGEHVGVAS